MVLTFVIHGSDGWVGSVGKIKGSVDAMVEAGSSSAKIEIFGSGGVLLYESSRPEMHGDRSLKRIVESLKAMQRETNDFLTSLVNEQSSHHTSKSVAVMDKDSADEEDDEDDENSVVPKKRKWN